MILSCVLLQGLEGQDLAGLSGGSDLAAQLLGDTDDLGHQLTVGRGLLALAQIDVVLEAHADVAAHSDSRTRSR